MQRLYVDRLWITENGLWITVNGFFLSEFGFVWIFFVVVVVVVDVVETLQATSLHRPFMDYGKRIMENVIRITDFYCLNLDLCGFFWIFICFVVTVVIDVETLHATSLHRPIMDYGKRIMENVIRLTDFFCLNFDLWGFFWIFFLLW